MKRKIAAMVMLGALFINPASNKLKNEDDKIIQSLFIASKAHFTEKKLVGWAKLEKEKQPQIAAQNLKDYLSSVQRTGPVKYETQLIPENNYIYINIVSYNLGFSYAKIKNKISDELYIYGNPYISTIYTGYYDGKLSKEEINKIVHKLFNQVKATETYGYTDETMSYYSGYTQKIRDVIEINSNKVNLNLAFRFNKMERKTYFYLGTPIISMDY